MARQFRAQLLPPPRAFYERELEGRLRRSGRDWYTTLCPFHPDKHPSLSVNVVSGGFYCFSCGAKGGDIVDFVMRRHGLSFKYAAQMLGAWDDSRTVTTRELHRLRKGRERQRVAQAARGAEKRQRRIEARDWLHYLERLYRADSNRLAQLERGDPECFLGERESCWEFLAICLPEIRDAEAAYFHLAEVQP